LWASQEEILPKYPKLLVVACQNFKAKINEYGFS
jgi:hypothetical protein